MSWKSMKDGKEKYAAYLCSREWSVLKEAVKGRSGGVCERCTINDMDHVHHLTYQRKYNERLEDLQACCKQCHEFIHGKSDYDPAVLRPAVLPWCGTRVKVFYLAGKITGTTWRDAIVPGWSEENHSRTYWQAFDDYELSGTWNVVPNVVSVLDGIQLHYSGPWWRDTCGTSGGHGSAADGVSPHCYSTRDELHGGRLVLEKQSIESRRLHVAKSVFYAITVSDMVFAWIDSTDCYGTLVEIGHARAIGKAVVVAFSTSLSSDVIDDMWLATQGWYVVKADSPSEAWKQFWEVIEYESKQRHPVATGYLETEATDGTAAR